jgi:hypothetical protein
MADKKISALPPASTPLAGTEVLPIVQGGITEQVSVANLTAGRAVSVSTLASTGNVAFGPVTPSAWTVYDLGTVEKTNGAFWTTFTDQSRFGLNAYYAFQWVYKQNGFSSQYEQTSGSHKFYTAPSGTAGNAITYTQALTVDQATNNVIANVGNFVVGTAGKGIDFSANTHAAGMTSELLNDYEEGTWTPTVSGFGSPTYSVQNGEYTKVGNLVHITGKLSFSGASGASAVSIGGLPYASADANDLFQRASCFVEGDWAGAALFITSYGMFRANGTSLQGVKNSAGSSALALASDFSATVSFNFSLTYYV